MIPKNMQDVKVKNIKCFSVKNSVINNRLDPFYYLPSTLKTVEKLKSFNFKKIKEISPDLKNGSTPPGGNFENYGIPYFRSQDFNLFEFKISQYITPEFHKKILRSSIKGGDVLLAVVGATLGVVGYVPDTIVEGNINQNVSRIRVVDKDVISKYLAIFLSSSIGQDLIFRNATITTQAYLNNSQLGNIEILIPSIDEQKKIIKIFDEAYKEKKLKRVQAKETLDSINSYILECLDIKIPEVKNSKCFIVNENSIINNRADSYYHQPKFKIIDKAIGDGKYEVKPLKDYIEKIHYGASVKNNYVDEGIPLLRILNLKPNKIDMSKVVSLEEDMRKELGNCFVNEGDLLISRSGSVGIVAVVSKEAKGSAFGSFMIKFILSDKINKDYVSYWLNNKFYQTLIQREKIGAIQGNITISTIENFKIPIPPIEIQNEIVKEIKKRIDEAEKLKVESKKAIDDAKKEFEKMIFC